ncbi:MAG: hypothetical protein J7647_22305 [Cyanobacteria bacterium SBLK]|nr:hypothetical protein [Cyanobacteria bacterium SBLK]
MAKQVICCDCGTFWWIESYETVRPLCPECGSNNWDLVSSFSEETLKILASKEPQKETEKED